MTIMTSIDELIARLELPSSTAATFINDERKEAAQALQSLQREVEELTGALKGMLDGFPLPATSNEYELVQAGCDPTEARKIAAAYRALTQSKDTVK